MPFFVPLRLSSLHLSYSKTQAYSFLSTCPRDVGITACALGPKPKSLARCGTIAGALLPGWHLPIIFRWRARPIVGELRPTHCRHVRGF